jgi:quinol monooxygenase YgiN
MLIVAGTFEVDPKQRDEFIAARINSMRTARSEAGCLDYVLSADPVDASRVVLFEKWENQAALDAHIAGIQRSPRPGGPAPKSVSLKIFDIAQERSFG